MNTLRRQIRKSAVLALCVGATAAAVGLVAGCERNDMHNQPRYEPLEESTFFPDRLASRQTLPNTIARGQLVPNNMRIGGLPQGPTPEVFPFEITKTDLERGRQRFDIYCSVCHGATGDADGMIVRRGFVKPPSFHEQRLKDAPVGHYFNVITNGFGAMYPYNDRIEPADRWRIAAYVRVLQLAQDKAVASVGGIAPANVAGGPSNQNPTPAVPGEKPAGSHQ
jgi:mono/diheme cytochrome c family protein